MVQGKKAMQRSPGEPSENDANLPGSYIAGDGSHQLPYPIVAIGASAGGLEALEALFTGLAPDLNAAFVVITHLDPGQESRLPEILAKYTRMPVAEARHNEPIAASKVFLISPGTDLTLGNGLFKLKPREKKGGLHLPFDLFLNSLGEAKRCNTVCVVLSGSGADGASGLKAVKSSGGIVIAQEPATAAYGAMPRNAMDTGLVDLVLPPAEIAERLTVYIRTQPGMCAVVMNDAPPNAERDMVRKILGLLERQVGHGLVEYKISTVTRRISKRMLLKNQNSLAAYLNELSENEEERMQLFKSLFIGVTGFFRDKKAFESLSRNVLPKLFTDPHGVNSVRVWVAGCSTGEEAYTIAILLEEYVAAAKMRCDVKIFATDIEARSIDVARRGVYGWKIQEDMPPALLEKYFMPVEEGYRVVPRIRDMVVFAVHDLLRDPPFLKLDLVMCRNLLIYLDSEAQKDVFLLFYHALAPKGHLFLGPAEALGSKEKLFDPVDKKRRIFRRRDLVEPVAYPRVGSRRFYQHPASPPQTLKTPSSRSEIEVILDNALLKRQHRAAVLVDQDSNVVRLFGESSRYLTLPDTEITTDLFKLVTRNIHVHLRAAFREAKETKQPAVQRGVKRGRSKTQPVTITVDPLQELDSGFRLVVFEEASPPKGEPEAGVAVSESKILDDLERDLAAEREYSAGLAAASETLSEELRSSNEELISMNEELQSSNEELETSRADIQAVNEELRFVNSELEAKIKELADSKNHVENLMKSTDVAAVFLDKEFRIRSFTPMARRSFHIILADVGRPLGDIANRFSEDVILHCKECLANLDVMEKEIRSNTGEWFIMRVLPYMNLTGEVEGVTLTFVDITRRKQAEDRLREMNEGLERLVEMRTKELKTSEARFRATFEQAAVGIGHYTLDGTITKANKKLCDIVGYACEELTTRSFVDITHPDDQGKTVELGRQLLAGETGAYGLEKRYIRKDGSSVWVNITGSLVRKEGGEPDYFIAVIEDISGRKQMEKALRERAHLLNLANVLVLNMDGTISMWNEGARLLYGWTSEEAVGKIASELLRTEFPIPLPKIREELLQTGRWAGELKHTAKDGGVLYVASDWVLDRDGSGEPVSILEVNNNVTALKKAQAAAEQATKAKSEFLANMSHEIRTPMNGILGFAEFLAKSLQDEKSKEYARIILQSGKGLLAIVNDILDFSKIEAGRVEIAYNKFDLGVLLESSCNPLVSLAKDKGLEFTCLTAPEVPNSLIGDDGRLRQVLTNLVGNAIKFTNKGTVTVTVVPEGTPAPGSIRLLFRIADTGIGIPEDKLDHIFESFTQVGTSAHAKFGGTGLGLAISKSLVELMGGRIRVESELGKGSTFSFTATLGLDEEERRTETPVPVAAPAQEGGLRVLVVEDNPINQLLAIKLLQILGHHVEAVANGREALGTLQAGTFDLVLMDVEMPDMDGVSALAAIRQGDAGRENMAVPVVAVTAHALAGDRERFLAAGMDDYLSKPVDFEELKRVLDKFTVRQETN
jgi:two-component system CheB/CheR fusion protein